MENSTTDSIFALREIPHEDTTMIETTNTLEELTDRNESSVRDMIRLFINLILSPVVITIGIFGNILTIKIFKSKKSKSASAFFIICLAVADLVLLIIKFIYTIYIIGFILFPNVIQKIPIRSMSWFYLADIPERTGKLLTIGIMAERTYAVYFPLKLKQVWTISRSRKIAAAFSVLILLTSVPPYVDVLKFFLMDQTNHSEDYTTIQEGALYINNLSAFMETFHLLNALIFDVSTLIIIFVLCMITSVGLKRTSNDLSFSNVVIQKRKKREKKITTTMLTMSFLFCLLCSPLSILGILVYVKVMNGIDVPLEVTGLTYLLLHLNSMVNFIIYGVADKTLRREYFQQMRCCRSKKRDTRQQEYQIHTCSKSMTNHTEIQTTKIAMD